MDARIHGRGIGSAILHSVITQARELAKDWPIRLFVLDALREKVSWYRDRGFDALIRTDLDKKTETVGMYLDLSSKEELDALGAYTDDFFS